MEFCEIQDSYSFANGRKLGISVDAFYERAISKNEKRNIGDRQRVWEYGMDLRAEWNWWAQGRPYYNAWPAITDILTGFDISHVPFRSCLSAPDHHIGIRFQRGRTDGVMCIMVSIIIATRKTKNDTYVLMVTTQHQPDDVKTKECPTSTVTVGIQVGREDTTFRDMDEMTDPTHSKMVSAAIAVLLMERNPELFTPVILARDVGAYQRASDSEKSRIEDRAIRRTGKRGYHLGQQMESMPHYRRPHPALYWTGKGGRIAKVIFRQGAIVNRSKLTDVPTGHLGPGCVESSNQPPDAQNEAVGAI